MKQNGLEATWADIMIKGKRMVIGSVYINVGKIGEIDILDEVIEKISTKHKSMVVCLDANSRDPIWDPSCLSRQSSSQVRKMGVRMATLILNNAFEIHNNGEITYESGPYTTAVDITISKGINNLGETKWRTIEDELQTPHKGIIIDIGEQPTKEKKTIVDWKKFNWQRYTIESKGTLKKLIQEWKNKNLPVESMAEQLKKGIEDLSEQIAEKKIITSHSKPWISSEVSDIFKKLRSARNRTKKHKSPDNISGNTKNYSRSLLRNLKRLKMSI